MPYDRQSERFLRDDPCDFSLSPCLWQFWFFFPLSRRKEGRAPSLSKATPARLCSYFPLFSTYRE